MNATTKTFVKCWNCAQPATHVMTREGSITLNACDNCTRIDREQAESRGWVINPLNEGSQDMRTEKQPVVGIEIGARVAGRVAGQSFTGVVCGTGSRGGRYALVGEWSDGKLVKIEAGQLESVMVRTDEELTMPSGRKVSLAQVSGAEALSTLRLL